MESSDHVEEVEHDENGHEEEAEETDDVIAEDGGEGEAEVEGEGEGDEEHVEGEEVGEDEEQVEGEEQLEGEEAPEDEEHAEAEEVEGDEVVEIDAEEEVDDDHEIQDEDGDEVAEAEGDDEAAEEEAATKKFPLPMENIGNFDAIEDSEIKELMKKTSLKLYDGSVGLLLSRGPKYSDDKWPINCHICYESGINSLQDLKQHLKSARHIRMLRWRPTDPKYKHMKAFRQPFDDEDQSLTPIFIYPGEVITDITPDLLDRVITKDKVPERELADMIGLSYGYKMKRFGKEIYDCVLCHKLVSVLHFAGQKHMDKYIDIHFPKTWKKLRNIIKEGSLGWTTALLSQQQKYIREVVRLIYKKLEEEKGVRQPKFVNYRDFKINRFTYQKQARSKKHYDEKTVTLTDEMLNDYLKQAHEKLGDPKTLAEEDKEKEEKEERSRRRSSSRDRKARRSKIIENDPQVWDRYRRMVGAIMDDLEETYEKFRKNLESHPKYKSEWKKFWHNRADELERDGIDPHTYDFNKEWIPYWEKRLQEFQAKEIVRHKFETKRKLYLSYDVRSPSPVRRRRRSPRRRTPSPRSRHLRRRSREMNEPRSKRTRRVDDEPLTVCAVMRIATALEDNLGSLGPQAVQLLSRAVLTEKSNPNPDCLLLENDYYIFFMTAKEKLKGQLIANIIEPRKLHAVERAVDQISAIINRFEDFRARHGGRGMFGPGGGGNGPDQSNRYQFSGGNRGGVWQSGGNAPAPPNQNFNRPMAPNNYGGGGEVDGFANQGGQVDYGNRGGNMSVGGGRHMSGGPSQFDNGTGSSFGPGGGNYGGNRGYGGNEGFGGASFRGESQRGDAPPGGPNASNYGPNRVRSGGPSGKIDMNMGRNHMQMGGPNRQSGGNPMDFGDGMNRGGSGNQMPFNRGSRSDNQMENMAPSFGGGASGNRPWSSGYHQSEISGGGNYGGGGMNMGGGNNWNSGDFGGTGGNQNYNNRTSTANPPACYRNVPTGGRY